MENINYSFGVKIESVDLESLNKMVLFINDECGGYEVPSILVDPNGIFSLSWYGKFGGLMITFDKDTKYSFLDYTGNMDFGFIDNNFDALRKKAGIKFLYEVSIFKKGKK